MARNSPWSAPWQSSCRGEESWSRVVRGCLTEIGTEDGVGGEAPTILPGVAEDT